MNPETTILAETSRLICEIARKKKILRVENEDSKQAVIDPLTPNHCLGELFDIWRRLNRKKNRLCDNDD